MKVMKKSGESLFNVGNKGHFMYLLEVAEIEFITKGRHLKRSNSERSLVRLH
jgi:hypothetical protein